MRYVRTQEGAVVEVIELPDEIEVADAFHPDLAAYIRPSPDAQVGWIEEAGTLVPPTDEGQPVDLAETKRGVKAWVDTEAEKQRLRWITPGAGQAMTYARKVEQAKAALAAADPQADDYPMLAASIGIDGPDIAAVAATVLAMDSAWEVVGAAIERERLACKQAVDQAVDEAAVSAVSPQWPNSP